MLNERVSPLDCCCQIFPLNYFQTRFSIAAIAAREEAELGAPSGSTNVVTRSGRRSTRGRQRGTAASGTRGRGRPRQSTQNQASLITAHVLPIEISSDSSDNGDTTYYDSTILSDDSSSDVDYIPGVGDEYYGGYGTCFNCGHRGHWANGCPF